VEDQHVAREQERRDLRGRRVDRWREKITEGIVGQTMLRRAATLEDVGNVAAFAASEHPSTMTATAFNISCGAIVD
jgi:enoyl-[acyl-carrier-protein] reductase (NADH)